MSKRKTAAILALLLAFTLALAACDSGGGTDPDTTTTGPETTTQATTGVADGSTEPGAQGREDVITFINSDINTLDHAQSALANESAIIAQIYDPLIFIDQYQNENMILAESYEVSEDGRVYTFKLREGVLFHNGEEMKASDVAFSFERNIESPYRGTQMAYVESCSAIDDYIFELTMVTPYAPTISVTIANTYIVNEKAVTEAGDGYGLKPVGTGPYMFVSYDTTNQVKLTRFDDYFRGPARIKDVTYKVITDTNTVNIALQSGEIDFGTYTAAAYSNITSAPNLVDVQPSMVHVTYLMMNHEVEPLNDPLVRQAINYALDRDFIIDAVMGGFARVAGNMLAPEIMGYSDAIQGYTEFDPDRAAELLAQAGITTPYDLGTITTMDGTFKTAAEMIQSNLADVGLIVNVEVLESTKYIEDAMSGDYTLGMMGISVGVDADAYNSMFTTDNIGGFNMARYKNPQVDELFVQGAQVIDKAQREAIYAECFNIIHEDAVYATLYNQNRLMAFNVDLQVDYVDGSNSIMIYDLGWK